MKEQPSGPGPPPSGPGIIQRCARTTLHAIVIIVATQALLPLLCTRPLGAIVANIVTPAYCAVWSAAVAAGLNADRVILAGLAVIITIYGWPDHLLPNASAMLAGAIIGSAIRSLVLEATYGRSHQ